MTMKAKARAAPNARAEPNFLFRDRIIKPISLLGKGHNSFGCLSHDSLLRDAWERYGEAHLDLRLNYHFVIGPGAIDQSDGRYSCRLVVVQGFLSGGEG